MISEWFKGDIRLCCVLPLAQLPSFEDCNGLGRHQALLCSAYCSFTSLWKQTVLEWGNIRRCCGLCPASCSITSLWKQTVGVGKHQVMLWSVSCQLLNYLPLKIKLLGWGEGERDTRQYCVSCQLHSCFPWKIKNWVRGGRHIAVLCCVSCQLLSYLPLQIKNWVTGETLGSAPASCSFTSLWQSDCDRGDIECCSVQCPASSLLSSWEIMTYIVSAAAYTWAEFRSIYAWKLT